MQKEANEVWRQIGLSMAWHALGNTPKSDAALTELIQKYEKDPRWLPFLRKLGKAPEQLAAIKFDVKLPQ